MLGHMHTASRQLLERALHNADVLGQHDAPVQLLATSIAMQTAGLWQGDGGSKQCQAPNPHVIGFTLCL